MQKFDTYNEWLTYKLFNPENKNLIVGSENDKPYTIGGPLHVSEAVFSWSFKESEVVNLSNGEYKQIHISLDEGDDWVNGLLRSDIPIEELPTLIEDSKYSHEFSVDGASVGFRPKSEVDKHLETYNGASFDDEYFDTKKVMNESWVTMQMMSDGSSDVYLLEKDGKNVGLIMDCDGLRYGKSYLYEAVRESALGEYGMLEIDDDNLVLIVENNMPGEYNNYLALTTHTDNTFNLANALYDSKDTIQSTHDKETIMHEIVATIPFKTFVLKGDIHSIFEQVDKMKSDNIELTNEDLKVLEIPSEHSL